MATHAILPGKQFTPFKRLESETPNIAFPRRTMPRAGGESTGTRVVAILSSLLFSYGCGLDEDEMHKRLWCISQERSTRENLTALATVAANEVSTRIAHPARLVGNGKPTITYRPGAAKGDSEEDKANEF